MAFATQLCTWRYQVWGSGLAEGPEAALDCAQVEVRVWSGRVTYLFSGTWA